MDFINRHIFNVVKRITQSYSAIMITGPRQVGKTTLLRNMADEGRNFVTLDNLDDRRTARNDPELFLAMYPPPVIIDEVQYAPELFSYIKIAIDGGAPAGSFWMTDSQQFRLMKLAQESLAGRIAILQMSSLSQQEIYGAESAPFSVSLEAVKQRPGEKADVRGIFERIWRGGMPAYVSKKHPERDIFFSSYVKTYVERDISDITEIKDTLQFTDFVRAAACRVGQVLVVHDIARDVGVSDDTAKRWLQLMEQTGVIFYLRPYHNNLLKRVIKAPKLYFFDTGLVAYLTRYSTPEILMNGAINGAILENFCIAEILKSYTNNGIEPIAHYYRDKDGREIDLLLESDGALYPVEVKKSAIVDGTATRAFKVLDGGRLARGAGAVICTKEALAAVDSDTFAVPVWML